MSDIATGGTGSGDVSAPARQMAQRLLGRDPGWRPVTWAGRRAYAALADVLTVTAPTSQHGRLVLAALDPQRASDDSRPPEEEAVRALLAHGQAPTPEAVAIEAADITRVAGATRDQVRDEGRKAAELVAGWWRATNAGPTWAELAIAMGWPGRSAADRHIRMLEKARWLTTGLAPRSLRPGPFAGGPAPVARGRDRNPAAGIRVK